MRQMKVLSFLLPFMVALPLGLYAQPAAGKITAKIVDAKNKPVAYATVTLLKQDSTVVNGDLTKEDGSFAIEPTGLGSFLLRINIIGFQERYLDKIEVTESAPELKLGKISINATSQTLNEVQITGERAAMELSVDKKVFNVERNITSSGGSATDVLKNVPSISVDIDGGVSLRGKETTLLIDGKPATLLGGDIASALQSLPASSIQSVEVITNPSAKFDAQGMSGIINIITKKDNRFGINGSASVGAGTRDKYNASVGLNLRNNRWNVFFNSNWRNNRSYQRTRNERRTLDGLLTSGSYEDNLRTHGGWFNTIGAEYTINSKSTIMLTQNLNQMLWGNEGNTLYTYNRNDFIDSSTVRSSNNLGAPLSSSTSLDYKYKFSKPKRELSTNATFAHTWVNRDQEFFTNKYDSFESPVGNTVVQRAPGGGTNTSLNLQADFTTPFLTKEGKLDAGWKSQLFWFESNNKAEIDRNDGAGFVSDPVLQNDYEYTQQIHAAYVSYSDQKGKLGYQAGLRLESSRYEGTSSRLISNAKYSNEFLNLFPSAFVSYKLPKDQAVYLSYTRRTNRPHFFQMMPYIDVSNPMDTSSGNPDLVPEFIHNTELNFSKQSKKGHTFIVSAYYQYTENMIDRIRTFYDDGTSFSRPQNLNKGVTYGTELTGRLMLLPIWNATVNFNFFRNEIYGNTVTNSLNNTGTSWFTKLNTDVRLPYNFSLQLNGTYEAPKVAAQGKVEDVYWLDIAIRKSLWSNKANIVLNISDIFNTRKYTTNYDLDFARQSIYRNRETQIGNLTFTYRFGKSEMKSNSRRGREQGGPQIKDRDNLKQGDSEGGF
ncbi:MAG TPA: TonB dependent receptor [Flavipsychrobacter sp.]|nr:TonB dependent receptor [Flavipsychrobacter sp.]